MILIIFGAAATCSLKHALKSNSHEIISFPVDFSIGPITNIHKKIGIQHYFTWLQSALHSNRGNLEDDQNVFCNSLQKISEIKDGEQITIWTCENASEQIGLRICCYLLKDKNVEVNSINTFHAMNEYMKDTELRMDIRHTGDCNMTQLLHFYKHSICPVTEEMKSDYVEAGENLLNNNSIARSWLQEKVVDEKETKDDQFIQNCVKRLQINDNKDYIKATIVIGEVIGHTDQPLSDVWIEYRIRSLIDSYQLEYEAVCNQCERIK
ncbi:hypothetical protein JCM21714_2741 [Gracilibacillus boraciitolerans JCM 21714]|uniref:DUF1835 domain-containing protein n=1 Tax=Gracilibacillus boraciitolerans JCM 21714 TaxID=1298598 RepID=W4VKG3_9BACI|nr:DUF1835 domain-containing protein [Gracilibacillus boraciitolerans]GAE93641.1 hypothetical protein JCM21714_2741 [Gracilibacillus boraciitolerans JCM 21714]